MGIEFDVTLCSLRSPPQHLTAQLGYPWKFGNMKKQLADDDNNNSTFLRFIFVCLFQQKKRSIVGRKTQDPQYKDKKKGK